MPVVGHRVDGLKVAQARLRLKGSPNQREFAERLGIHWVTMSRIENGKANVSLDLLERIAAETGHKRDHFLAVEDDEEESRVPALSMLEELYGQLSIALGKVPA